MSGARLEARDLTRTFPDGTRALDGVSFAAEAGRVLVLLGPSGCGKSTLLRIIAGLDHPTSGALTLDGRPLDAVPAPEREVGFVFQNYALYPHLTVAGNLGLALEVRGIDRAERERRVRETAERLGIGGLLARRPAELSGGQQQRVALGRALVKRPRFYLLDEPLSNLDALLREDMRSELKALFASVDAIVVYVTHDQAEAMSLADRVAVMQAGRIVQCAPPLEVHRRPATAFVAAFVGSPRMNLWEGVVEYGTWRPSQAPPLGEPARIPAPRAWSAATLGIRPEDVEVVSGPAEGAWPAEVELFEPLGARALVTLRTPLGILRALVAAESPPERPHVRLPAARRHWYDSETGVRLDGDS
jgi:ABC-type sugar transport system ATPase subunit